MQVAVLLPYWKRTDEVSSLLSSISGVVAIFLAGWHVSL